MATVSPSSSTVDILFICFFLLFLHRVPLPVIKTINKSNRSQVMPLMVSHESISDVIICNMYIFKC